MKTTKLNKVPTFSAAQNTREKMVFTGKRKRGVGKATPRSSSKLAAQVKQLMRMKQEKKFVDHSETGNCGQVDGSSSGAYVKQLVVAIPQGDGEGQRIGNSVTGTGLVAKQQFFEQSATNGIRRVRSHVIRTLDPGMSTTEILEAVLDVNPMSEVRDYFSGLNYTMMRDKRVTILGTAETELHDNLGVTTVGRLTGDLTIPIKFDDQTIRFVGDSSSTPANVRYHVLTVCDNGNIGSGSSSKPVFITGANTGLQVKSTGRLWYTDS